MVVPCSFTYTLYLIGGSRGPSASSPFRGLIKNRDFWNSITIIGALVDGSSETLPDEWGSKIGRLPATNDSRSLRDLLYCCKWTGRRKQPINGTNTFLFIARRPCLALSVTAIHCSLFLSLSSSLAGAALRSWSIRFIRIVLCHISPLLSFSNCISSVRPLSGFSSINPHPCFFHSCDRDETLSRSRLQ